MTKIVMLWAMGLFSVAALAWGGIWLYRQLKKEKLFK